jgi:hypothetical protein
MTPKPKTIVPVVNGTVDAPSVTEVRSFPCPDCGEACNPEKIITPDVQKEISPGGDVVNLPSHFVYLQCRNCHLHLLIGVDKNFKLIEEIDIGDNIN